MTLPDDSHGPTPANVQAIRRYIHCLTNETMTEMTMNFRAPGTEVRIHSLKCWPEYFEAVACGVKTFEVRRNDRDYRVGDELHLREWDPDRLLYTGRGTSRLVSYILRGPAFGIQKGFVVMGLSDRFV